MTVTPLNSISVSQSTVGPSNPVTGALSPPSADGQLTPQQTEFTRAFQRQTGTSDGNLSRRGTAGQPNSKPSTSPEPTTESRPVCGECSTAESTPLRPDRAEESSHVESLDHAETKRPSNESDVDNNPITAADDEVPDLLGVEGGQRAMPQSTQTLANRSDETADGASDTTATEDGDTGTASSDNATSTPPAETQSTKPFLQIFVPSQSASDQDAQAAGDANSDHDAGTPRDAPSGLVRQFGRGRRQSDSINADADQVAADDDRVSLSFQAFRRNQLAKSQSGNGQNDAGSDSVATESQKQDVTETGAVKPAAPVVKSAASNRREAADATTDPQATMDGAQQAVGVVAVSGNEKPDKSVKAESQRQAGSEVELESEGRTESQEKGTSGLKTDFAAKADSQAKSDLNAKTDSDAKSGDLAKQVRREQITGPASPTVQVSAQHVEEAQKPRTSKPDCNVNPDSGSKQPEQVASGTSLRRDVSVARDEKSKTASQTRVDAAHDDTATVGPRPVTLQPQGVSTTANSDPLAQLPSDTGGTPAGRASHEATQRREVTMTTDGTSAGGEPAGSSHRGAAGSTAGSTMSSPSGTNSSPLDPRVDVDRLAQTVRIAGESRQTMSVRLNPGHLGTMQIDVSVEHGVATARLQVESLETHRIITDGLDRLRESLSRAGAHVERVEVTVVKSTMQHEAGGRFDGNPSDGQPHSNGEGFQDRGESTDHGHTPDQPRLSEVEERTAAKPKPVYRRANGLEQIDIQV